MIPETFLSTDGKSNVHVKTWPVDNPKAVLQIAHGMSEYIERYGAFAEYLNANGIAVVGHDHIGHGRSSDRKDYGYFGEKDGWLNFASDVQKMFEITKAEYPDIPYFMMGHSMGSFIVRTWFGKHCRDIDGVIFMGTAGANPALGAGKSIVSVLRKLKGDRHISKLITAMAFGSYNKHIPDAKTHHDWLTRDDAVIAEYVKDPACGFTFSLAGYADLFNLLTYINSDRWYKDIPKDIPVLLVAGDDDPVGSYGKGPSEVAGKMEDAGCEDISLLLYEGMRHEILNEFGKEAVMEDIKKFILDEECEGTADTE